MFQYPPFSRTIGSRRTVFMLVVSILITSCQGTSLTPVPSYALSISETTVGSLVPLKEWELYTVNSITWAMDSSAFAIAGSTNNNDGPNVFAFNVDAPSPLWSQKLHQPTTFSLTYSLDNKSIVIPYRAGFGRLDATSGQVIKGFDEQYATPDKVCFGNLGIEFSPNGKNLIMLDTALEYGYTTVNIWDIAQDQCVGKLVEQSGISFGFDLSKDGIYLALGLDGIGKYYEQQVHVWNLETQQQVCAFEGSHPVSLTPDGITIAAVNISNKGEVDLWNRITCQVVGTFQREGSESLYSLAFSPDGTLLAIGGNNSLEIWHVASGKILFEFNKLKNRVSHLAFSPNGLYLVSSTDRVSIDDNSTITLWGVTKQ